MSEYGWIVEYDHLDGKPVCVQGPNGITLEQIKACSVPFRLFDDDGNLYYSGRMTESGDGFGPLYDYGMPNAGCTEIRIKENGKWSTL